ncbi:guanylate kinase [Ekhidna lutea]|uniref:Guanylate kinase n=1 Tax=Ekhidna lutea TaxID=447679 RepID=A0A239JAN9_EKHLU|nr:guanylate kinase [Ekhidna lutea]SNT02682.1 guanylate kinase [Ekhidna lutea]
MEGKAIIFSAPSGAGKTTIVHSLLDRIPNLRFSISATTRAKRTTEIDGRDYYFLAIEEFKQKQSNGELLEWEEVYTDTFYGTLRSEVERLWEEGNHVIFDVDVKGGKKLKKILGSKALSIFVKVKGEEVLRDRLKMRNTESEETLSKRINKAAEEMKEEVYFDEVILNDNLDIAIDSAESIVKAFIK